MERRRRVGDHSLDRGGAARVQRVAGQVRERQEGREGQDGGNSELPLGLPLVQPSNMAMGMDVVIVVWHK